MKTGWAIKPLGKIGTLQRGFDLPKAQRTAGRFPLVTSSGVTDTHDVAKVKGPGVATGRSGSIGNVFYVDEDFWPLNTALYVKDFHGNDPRFVYYLLQLVDLGRFSSGAGVPTLNRNDVHGELFAVPQSVEEQQRIVAVLDEAFEGLARARTHAEANLQNARELFENALEAEVASLRHSSETSLGEHIDLLAGFAFKSKGYTDDPNAMPLMRGDNIIPGAVRWKGAKYWPIDDCEAFEKFKLIAHDVVIAMDRTWIKAGIKYAVLSDDDIPCLLVQRVARLRCLASLDTHFLAMLIGSKSFEGYVLSIQTGTGVPHISPTQIKDFKFPLPDIDTQARIVERLMIVKNASNDLLETYSKKLQDIDNLRQSLLRKAFAGELT
ncbi:restriction endonuclease subunit S [Rhodobacteraceae bacterium KMM 6894]|nr:restriction endonuclease subunit S [Rhodobacteraceae bacterium KMM 6894]